MLKPTYILAGFMIGLFTIVAMVAIFTDYFSSMLPHPRNYLFGGVLVLYALVRITRLRRQMLADKHHRK